MKVAIFEKNTNHVVAIVPVSLGSLSDKLNESYYFEEAWRSASEDNLIDVDKVSEYEFKLLSQ
jgi:hypothetical protein